jgi:hypothetical protein
MHWSTQIDFHFFHRSGPLNMYIQEHSSSSRKSVVYFTFFNFIVEDRDVSLETWSWSRDRPRPLISGLGLGHCLDRPGLGLGLGLKHWKQKGLGWSRALYACTSSQRCFQ